MSQWPEDPQTHRPLLPPATPPQWQPGAPPRQDGPRYQPPPPPPRGQPNDYLAPPRWEPPRRRRWVARHKILTGFIAGTGALVLIVIVAVASASPGPDTAALAACASHHAISSRQWLQVAKDPGAAKGQCITVYGEVTQFDSVTGNGTFRAQAGGVKAPVSFGFADYPTNALFDGDGKVLGSLVEGDLFTAKVTVAGSQTYKTQIGGSTTVPVFRVDSVERTGHLGS